MNSKVFGLYLLLPASLSLFAGCAQTDSAPAAPAEESEQVTSAPQPLNGSMWSQGVAIPGAFALGTPSLGMFRNRMHMLYRGMNGSNRIFMSRFNNGAWEAGVEIANILSRVTPALGIFNDRLMAVYPHHRTNRLMMSLYDGNAWSDGVECGEGLLSGLSPSLASFNRNMYLAYRGLGSNQLYLSAFDGNRWNSPFAIDGARSRVSPSLAVYGNRLNMFYPGVNNQLFLNAYDGQRWGSPLGLPGTYAPWSPGLGIYQNALNAIYPMSTGGYGFSGYGLGWSQWNGQNWASGVQIPGITAAFAPAVGLYGNHLGMVYPGMNNQLYWSSCQ